MAADHEVRQGIFDANADGVNKQIKSGQGLHGEISLWALTSGQLQLHAPGLPPEVDKPYDFIFDSCGTPASTP